MVQTTPLVSTTFHTLVLVGEGESFNPFVPLNFGTTTILYGELWEKGPPFWTQARTSFWERGEGQATATHTAFALAFVSVLGGCEQPKSICEQSWVFRRGRAKNKESHLFFFFGLASPPSPRPRPELIVVSLSVAGRLASPLDEEPAKSQCGRPFLGPTRYCVGRDG